MTVREFWGKLKSMDRRYLVIPGQYGIFGLYLKAPRHPDASSNGLVHVGGVSAPMGFCGPAPRKDYVNVHGVECRGYLKTLRILKDKGYLDGGQVTRYFGHDWRTA